MLSELSAKCWTGTVKIFILPAQTLNAGHLHFKDVRPFYFLSLLAIGRLIFIDAITADYNVESMSTKQWFALLIFWFIYLIVARPNVS